MIETLEPRTLLSGSDLNGDGTVSSLDYNIFAASYQKNAGGDINGDGKTDSIDFNFLVRDFGKTVDNGPPIAGTWKQVFSDDFNANPLQGGYVENLWGLGQYPDENMDFQPGNVTVANGILSLTAKKQTSNGKPYTSGQVHTGGDLAVGGHVSPLLSFKYGYIETRAKMAAGKGMWNAFWMLPTPNPNYHDGDGEIDIFEVLGDATNKYEMHLHHNGVQGSAPLLAFDMSAAFHVYAIDWEADHLTWYVDGKAIFTVTQNVPQVAEYLILSLDIGSDQSWPGAPDSSTPFPNSEQFDYLRVWQKQ